MRIFMHCKKLVFSMVCGVLIDVKTLSSMLGHFSAGFTLDTYTHITNDMQRGAAEKIGGFMESATAATTPEPPNPPEQSRCKVIPFEKVG